MDNTSITLKTLLINAYEALRADNKIKGKNLLEKANAINPNIFEVNFNLGILNNNLNNFEDSIKFFENAKKLNQNNHSIYSNLGFAYEKINNTELSLQNYHRAIKLDSSNAVDHFNLGTLYKKIKNLEKSEIFLKNSISLKPDYKAAFINLFDVYDRSNQFEKYENLLKEAETKIDDKNLWLFYSGQHLYKIKEYKRAIKILEDLKLNKEYYLQEISRLHILAKSYDQIGEYSKAFIFFKKNNNLFSEYKGKKIDKNIYIKYVEQRINYFNNFNLNNWSKNIIKSKFSEPIFLIGFPRSGTTLLDTILRTHKSLDVIEEKPIIKNFLIQLEKKTLNDFTNLDNLDQEFIEDMQNFYFKEREKYQSKKDVKLVIDKLPLNIIHIAEILRFFPNAKFIFALRHPYDSVLSCFMQQFDLNPSMKNFISLESSAFLYDLVMKLWKIYKKNFLFDSHFIKYEDVVTNFETTIKKLFEFIGVNWTNELNKFYLTARNRRDIATPSYNQVTSPLYLKSLNRWKNYNLYFKDSKIYLDKWVNEFDYKF